jgi:hypothetical protein
MFYEMEKKNKIFSANGIRENMRNNEIDEFITMTWILSYEVAAYFEFENNSV